MADSREARLVDTFVTLADTLVAGYDVVDLLQTLVEACAELLEASAAGLMLADSNGELAVVASTSERSRLVEMMQLKYDLGPCVQSFATGDVVQIRDIAELDKWPDFKREALAQGFRAVHAVPMKLRGNVIGTLNLFSVRPGLLEPLDAAAAKGLADVATISILHERALRENEVTRVQLQSALDSRVIIEQAKGVVAQTRGVDMDQSFHTLRDYARSHNLALRDVAKSVVERELTL
ncbi:GAF and ANTAR domain-containing protein [soil metagenome]